MSTYNRTTATILASAARTALVGATDLQVLDGTNVVEVIDVQTAHTATPGRTLTIKDAAGATLLTSAAITTVDGTIILRYGIGVPIVTNLSAYGIPAAGMTIEVAVADTDSATYSITRRTA